MNFRSSSRDALGCVVLIPSVVFLAGQVQVSTIERAGATSQHRTLVPANADPARAHQATPRGRWGWPIDPKPRVLRRFQPPDVKWGAGHRGVDLAAAWGAPVLAVADGTVTHSGVIAGRGTVTVQHPDGVRSTYEPVSAGLPEGSVVRRGQQIALLTQGGDQGHCAPHSCLHLGAIRDNAYINPLRFIAPRPIVLLPNG